MYVLDTNAFYYASEISSFTYDLSKLQKLISENEVFISTTTLFEFLVKYKNNIGTIQKGGKYLRENNIRIASNVINPIPKSFVNDLENITEEQLSVLCADVLENKIDVESRWISLLFNMCLFSGYHFVAMSSGQEPSKFCNGIMTLICRMFGEITLDAFVEIFTDGYKTNDCENYVRNCFYNLLAFDLEKGIRLLKKLN